MLIGFNTLCYSLPYTHMVMSVLTQREERCIEYMQYTPELAHLKEEGD